MGREFSERCNYFLAKACGYWRHSENLRRIKKFLFSFAFRKSQRTKTNELFINNVKVSGAKELVKTVLCFNA
jgi:hypothetical protein